MKTCIHLSALFALSFPTASAYDLHEWGTFTTVAGSDGVLLPGLQREEVELPSFVHAHFGFENGQQPEAEKFASVLKTQGYPAFPSRDKGLGKRPVSGVTVKMETPVIYFHSDTAFHATVKVGFEGGTISQWYPDRSGGETLPEPPPSADPEKHPVPVALWNLDFAKPYHGAIAWDVDVLSPADSKAALGFKPRDTLNWMRARVPEANTVRTTKGETENYLFYRGVGNFTPGLQTTVSPDDTLHLKNLTGGDIPYLLVFEQDSSGVHWTARPGLKAGEALEISKSALTRAGANNSPTYSATGGYYDNTPIYDAMRTGLAGCGLLESEANAMVQTWWSSYFETEGLRVFWVLPAATTDKLLPLSVSPAPDKTIRVMVGRSEVIRPSREAEWLALSQKTGDDASQWKYVVDYDRFGLAIQERIRDLRKASAAKAPLTPPDQNHL